MSKKHSILGLIPLFKALESENVSPEALLENHDLPLDDMTGAAVIDQSKELEIVAEAIKLVDDPLLGIKVGNQISFTSYGTYAMLLMTADTMGDAIKAGVQFQSLSLLFSHMIFDVSQDWVEIRYIQPELKSQDVKTFVADRDLMGVYIFLQEIVADIPGFLIGAGTARVAPEKSQLAEYQSYIPLDVSFNQPYNWFRFSKEGLGVKNKRGNALAHKLYCLEAYEIMHKLYPSSEDVVTQVSNIIEGFHNNYPSLKDVAKMFSVSERTLNRKLDEAGTNYREILDSHRKSRALSMMTVQNLSLDSVAEQLGYSEPASFIRAFKRWTGMTPKQFQKHN